MTLENHNYRTGSYVFMNQFPSDNAYGIPTLPKVAFKRKIAFGNKET